MVQEPSRRVKKKRKFSIGIDLMGSDASPQVLADALARFATSVPSYIELICIGNVEPPPHILYHPATEFIGMDETPLLALRQKKRSSLSIGMRLLKKRQIDALVSAGNTGALTSAAKWELKTFDTLKRPALLALLPTQKRPVAVLDIGANIKAGPIHLLEFAYLGAAYQKTRGVKMPRVGLLNIGQEPFKGSSELCASYALLKEKLKKPSIDFVGNIEGHNAFDGNIDVLLCSGLMGNTFLKTAEGITKLIFYKLSATLPKNTPKSVISCLDTLARHLYATQPPGALLCGVNGLVIKCHGASSTENFIHAVRSAIEFTTASFLTSFQNEFFALSSVKNASK